MKENHLEGWGREPNSKMAFGAFSEWGPLCIVLSVSNCRSSICKPRTKHYAKFTMLQSLLAVAEWI